MSFRDELLAKIEIQRMAGKVMASIDPSDSTRRIDLETMRGLVKKGAFTHIRERDLDLYLLEPDDDPPRILVLDNELTIYRTTIDDIVLRKSPTIKEMVNIRNAIRILSDSDVVVSKKADTVQAVAERCIGQLDLAYSKADIEALRRDAAAT
jgi:SpoVK/Ycf46/Vps4 family AAA+-type ATPase